VVAKYVVPYAPPLTFLSLRFVGCILTMLALMVWAGKRLPRGKLLWHTAAVGVLMQFGYLAGCWMATAQGMPAGVVALIVNLQPVLTAVLGFWVGEQVSRRQWAGLALGFVGVALVLSTKLGAANYGAMGWVTVVLAGGALVSMTIGTLYQKRFCPGIDARASQVVQFAASLLVSAPLAWAFETQPVVWGAPFWGALAFSVVILSGVGISLLLWMIERGQAVQVTGYMYWVPPISSLMAWFMFDERLSPLAWLGFVCVALGVWAVVRVNAGGNKRIKT
jgi:drug/metabolite transporter (DMT)-like permease